MRNASLNSSEKVALMLGGLPIRQRLPWYRRVSDEPTEADTQALSIVAQQETMSREFSIALDSHSGFDLKDRIWFSCSHSRTPIPQLPEILALKDLFNQTYRDHNYLFEVFEAKNNQHLTHGDLWDYFYCKRMPVATRLFCH